MTIESTMLLLPGLLSPLMLKEYEQQDVDHEAQTERKNHRGDQFFPFFQTPVCQRFPGYLA